MNAMNNIAGRTTTTLLTGAASTFSVTMPIFGVPLNVVVAAFFGVMAEVAWDNTPKTRWALAKLVFATVMVASASTALLVRIAAHFGWTIDEQVLPPLALMVAFFGPKWVPAINDRIGPWLDRLPFIGKKGG